MKLFAWPPSFLLAKIFFEKNRPGEDRLLFTSLPQIYPVFPPEEKQFYRHLEDDERDSFVRTLDDG
jgi:hypothetical protein